MGQGCRIVVVGASAGGVPSLQALVAGLPANLNAAVLVVLHIAPYTNSNLARILDRHGPLPAVHAQDGEDLRPGQIYVSSPDYHLLVDGDHVGVKHGPKENRFRPSIDALFRSAAYTRKEQVIGIVLSGLLNDGTSGLWSIKRFGGTTIVQDPRDAAVDSMPLNALAEVEVD
ncbi:chemotaxis protein CheB, partial [Methylobacterium frigidaeris]